MKIRAKICGASCFGLLNLLAGCAGSVEAEVSAVDLQQAILDGEIELGFAAVGNILSARESQNWCTGTLVSPEFVLTAAHCGIYWYEHEVTDNTPGLYRFLLGNDPSDFTEYKIDGVYNHPNVRRPADVWAGPYDVMLFHLAPPEGDSPEAQRARERLQATPLMEVGGDIPVGEDCTTVGFGTFSRDRDAERDVRKRSAFVKVESSTDTTVIVSDVTGIPFGGDSGGPLICDAEKRTVSALVHQTGDVSTAEGHRLEEYNRVDSWVKDFLSKWAAGDHPPPNPIAW